MIAGNSSRRPSSSRFALKRSKLRSRDNRIDGIAAGVGLLKALKGRRIGKGLFASIDVFLLIDEIDPSGDGLFILGTRVDFFENLSSGEVELHDFRDTECALRFAPWGRKSDFVVEVFSEVLVDALLVC